MRAFFLVKEHEIKAFESVIIEHFNQLSSDDLYSRFGYTISKDSLSQYIDSLITPNKNYKKKFQLIFNDGKLVALGYLFITSKVAEISISVTPCSRGSGLASHLFFWGNCVANKYDLIYFIQCISSNKSIIKLMEKYGMKIVRNGTEVTGTSESDYECVKF